MKMIAESYGKYLAVGDGGYNLLPNPCVGFADESKSIYVNCWDYSTPISFNIAFNKSHTSMEVDPINEFDSDDETNEIRQLMTRHTLGSVHYRNGLRRHDYNGVYHAKVDGTVHYKSKPSLSHWDATRVDVANRLNPWTGMTGGPRKFVVLQYGVNESGTVEYRCYQDSRPYYGGWRTVHAQWQATWTDVTSTWGSAKALLIVVSYSMYLDKPTSQYASYGVYTKTFGTVVLKSGTSFAIANGDPTFQDFERAFGQFCNQKRGIDCSFVETNDASRWVDALTASRDVVLQREFLGTVFRNTRVSYPSSRNYYDAVEPSISDMTEDARLLSGITERLVGRLNNSHLSRQPDFHDLAARAYQDIGMWNGNGLLYVNDAAHLAADTRDFVKTLKSLRRNVKKGRLPAAVKDAARTFLSVHYGYRLSIADTRSLIKALDDPRHDGATKKAQASETFTTTDDRGWTWEVTARYQVFYNAMTQDNLLSEFLHLLDLVPDLENIWDMIPYSFVVDWFVKLGDLFAAMDNYHEICSRYDVEAAGRSTKYVCQLTADMLGLSRYAEPSLVFSVYYRGYSTSPTIPIPSTLINPVNPFTHSVEAGALLVSK